MNLYPSYRLFPIFLTLYKKKSRFSSLFVINLSLQLNVINKINKMTTLEKLVDGATKIKMAPPKPKYMEPILMSTSEGVRSDNFQSVMKALRRRLNDSAWTIVYKSLIVIHIMIREGEGDVTLDYLKDHHDILNVRIGSNGKFIDNGGSIRQIKCYASYLQIKSREYGLSDHDFIKETKKPYGSWDVSDKNSILRDLPIEKGLLRETESVERLIQSLIKCSFQESEVNSDVIVLSFRMLTADLISLYQTLNEGVLNILEHFFELSKPDAQRAYDIYIVFTKLTVQVVSFLRTAKHLENVTKCRVPTIKHAQTSLGDSLRDYIDDPDFDITRRQYLAEKKYVETNVKSGNSKSEKDTSIQPPQPIQKQHLENVEQQKMLPPLANPSVPTGNLEFQQTGFNPFTNFNPQQVTGVNPVNVSQFTMQDQQQFLNQTAQLQQQQAVQEEALRQQQQQQQQQAAQEEAFRQQQAAATAAQQQQQQQLMLQQQALQQQFTNQPAQFTNQPSQFNNQQIPLPQAQQQLYAIHYTAPNGVNTLPQITENSIQQSAPRPSSTLQFTNTGNFSSPQRSNTFSVQSTHNPFALSLNSTGSNNPFGGNTTFSLPQPDLSVKPKKLSKAKTGTNPFRLETDTTAADKVPPGPVQPLQRSYTAGGLENSQTIPVFPETQREAHMKSVNPFNAELTGFQQQQQNTGFQQQQLQQQQQQQLQQQSFPLLQQQTSFTSQTGFQPQVQPHAQSQFQQQNSGFSFQPNGVQPNFQQTGFSQQPQFQFQTNQFNGSAYNGPNLLE